jgi:hypothetical protein
MAERTEKAAPYRAVSAPYVVWVDHVGVVSDGGLDQRGRHEGLSRVGASHSCSLPGVVVLRSVLFASLTG